jgi:hypothetical protein
MDIDQGLRAASEKLRKILDKRKRGKPLTAAEQAFLNPQPSTLNPSRQGPNVEDSLDSAVSALREKFGDGVNRAFLKQLKKKHGTKAGFRGSRVHLDQLIPFLEAEIGSTARAASGGPKDKHSLECEKLLEQIQDLRDARAIRQGKYVERTAVITSNRRLATELKKLLRKLETEMPGAVAGKDIPEARIYGGKLYTESCRIVQSWSEEWPE